MGADDYVVKLCWLKTPVLAENLIPEKISATLLDEKFWQQL